MTHNRGKRRHFRGALVLCAATVLVVLAIVVFTLLPKQGKPDEEPVNPYAGMVRVSDGSNLVWLTPKDGVAVSPLSRHEFTKDDAGHIRYNGTQFTTQQGVDLSFYQSSVDWEAAAESGVEFALLRIGFRGYTKGVLQPDDAFEQNFAGAKANGVETGIYFFSQALNAQEGQEEAEYVLSLLRGRDIELPVYFDWELISAEDSRTNGYDFSALTDSAEAFCRTIEAAGYEAGVYCSRQQGYYHYDLSRLTDYALWVSDPNDYPDFYYAMDIWQYTFEAEVAGIDGGVDMNLRFVPVERVS